MKRACSTFLAVLALSAGGAARASDFLSGSDLQAEFAGRTITGYYLDTNVRFLEIYRVDGRITYRDDLKADVGRWHVRGDLFCTFYNVISGACWHVRRVNANCLEFFSEESGVLTLPPLERATQRPEARAAREGERITCEAWRGS